MRSEIVPGAIRFASVRRPTRAATYVFLMPAMLSEPAAPPPPLPRPDLPAPADRAENPDVPEAPAPLADPALLEDRLPAWARMSRTNAALVAVAVLLVVVFARRPLWHTDLWGHLAYGRTIVERWSQGLRPTIPETEPLLALSSGVRFVDVPWLSQVAGYLAFRASGPAALQFAYAVLIVAAALMPAVVLRRAGRSLGWCLAGTTVFLAIEWQQLLVIRPQLAGLVCFSLVVALVARRARGPGVVAGTAVLFALWSNLHGSYPVGWLVLGTACVGRAVDTVRRTGRVRSLLRSRPVRDALLLTQVAIAASLANPYGIGAFPEVLTFAAHPNVAALVEWQPLDPRTFQGQAAFVVALLLAFVLAHTPRRVSTTELLLVVGLGTAAVWTSRMIVWWGPVASVVLVVHASAIAGRRAKRKRRATEDGGAVRAAGAVAPRRGMWTLASIGLAWIGFALTPLGARVLHGESPDPARCFTDRTPVGIVEHLRRQPPAGLVFATFEWGDYLLFAGPPGIRVPVASHAHLVPEEVWQHHLQVTDLAGDWRERLDRDGVQVVVLAKWRYDFGLGDWRRVELIDALREGGGWGSTYEDGLGVVLRRAGAKGESSPAR